MQRKLESYSTHTQIVQKFKSMFPNLAFPRIDASNSIFEALNDITRNIPCPPLHETQQTIYNMKHYVDGQQLRIQMNMIEIDEAGSEPANAFSKKHSSQTRDSDDSWDEQSINEVKDIGWESQHIQYHQNYQFTNFID